MANKRPQQNTEPLADTDRVLWVELAPGTYALARGAVLMVNEAKVSTANPLPVILEQSGGQVLLTDDTTGALSTIDVVHHEVHEGDYWTFERSSTIANGTNSDVRLLTGTGRLHFTMAVVVTGLCALYLYEAANISAGTALAAYNRDRASAVVAPYTATHTPVVTGVGTVPLINARIIPGGNSPLTRVGAEQRENLEWILLPSTEYLIRVTNNSGANATINIYGGGYVP